MKFKLVQVPGYCHQVWKMWTFNTHEKVKEKNLDLDFVNLSREVIGVLEGKGPKTQSPKGN